MSMTDPSPTQPSDGMPAVDTAVRVRGVTKEFGTGGSLTRALRGVDLDVPYGELLILAGPSGCGKTTLVSIVAGTLEPSDGEVVVLGKDLVAMSNGRKVKFRRENVGFVFQSYNLLPSLTAAENAAVPLLIAGWHRSRAVEAASDVLDKLAENGRITMELISNIAVQPDRAVIVVTHDSRVYSFADRIANMEDGRIESVEAGPLRTGTIGRSDRS